MVTAADIKRAVNVFQGANLIIAQIPQVCLYICLITSNSLLVQCNSFVIFRIRIGLAG